VYCDTQDACINKKGYNLGDCSLPSGIVGVRRCSNRAPHRRLPQASGSTLCRSRTRCFSRHVSQAAVDADVVCIMIQSIADSSCCCSLACLCLADLCHGVAGCVVSVLSGRSNLYQREDRRQALRTTVVLLDGRRLGAR